jgi:hypothetical protein
MKAGALALKCSAKATRRKRSALLGSERLCIEQVEEIFAMTAQYPQIPIGMNGFEQISPSNTVTAAPARGLGLRTHTV